jgi:hypothetical protein
MKYLRVQAVRWVADQPIPGIVEVRFRDASGVERVIVDKAPVFDPVNVLTPTATYPIDLGIPVEVVRTCQTTDGEVVEIGLPWGLDEGQELPIQVPVAAPIDRP